MDRLMIVGKTRLSGTARVNGSKNASLAIMAACLLCPGQSVLKDVPRLQDIATMSDVLSSLGAGVFRDGSGIIVDAQEICSVEVEEALMRRMRASNLVLGPLLGRFREAKISQPGGCNIGARPMDLHLKGLRALGAEIKEEYGYISARAKKLSGAEIQLDFPSVGATENIMMAAVLAEGVTVIRGAAKEPEIVDLQNFLNCLGARVSGAGTDIIRIEGVASLRPAVHQVIPDRIEAGTYIIAAAITGGDVTVTNVIPEHLRALTAKLAEAGVEMEAGDDCIRVRGTQGARAVDVKTMPYPGFPTDLQPQMTAFLALAEGTSVITETIFENRFRHVSELARMGAQIKVEGQTVVIKGRKKLHGAPVEAGDLRAGAALLLAAMAAENGTLLGGVEHIDRGYERIEQKYNALGARITRVRD
ncbi:MAG: UDP-N-acetylglucosamine 1-carboxyvinyltransferase [Desulfotomaculales bacterium]